MVKLYEISNRRLSIVPDNFRRFLFHELPDDEKMIGIKGGRGTGKTTLLLQVMKTKDLRKSLYISLDNLYFTQNTLVDTAEQFVREGGLYLYLDEVHKYPNWSRELKNIYDDLPELKVMFTSSSALEIQKGKYDLSRRALIYELPGLSFREYINLTYSTDFKKIKLEEIIEGNYTSFNEVMQKIRPYEYLDQYLKHGYYPFFMEGKETYALRLQEVINHVIETDLPAIERIDLMSVQKIKKLVYILGSMAPYTPNISKLAQQLQSTRDSVLKYLYSLHKAHILTWLTQDAWGINFLNKPDKLYLENSNIAYALVPGHINTGTLRETFFLNQVSQSHQVRLPKKGDFLVNDRFTFEVGGKNKTVKQIAGIPDGYVVSDSLEYGHGKQLPLWIFGFLY